MSSPVLTNMRKLIVVLAVALTGCLTNPDREAKAFPTCPIIGVVVRNGDTVAVAYQKKPFCTIPVKAGN